MEKQLLKLLIVKLFCIPSVYTLKVNEICSDFGKNILDNFEKWADIFINCVHGLFCQK